ncbi:MAG: M4 family metallopeptidase [Verrucomicrobiales bacterium]|nr:M4 family metallopeptidase [Verrucomicrobiales bacterium]
MCILPPYMLENLEQKGNQRQRAYVQHTLEIDDIQRNARSLASGRLRGLRGLFRLQRQAMGRVRWRAAGATCTGQADRSVHTANNGQRLPGQLVRDEGEGATGDAAVDEAYDGLGKTYDLFCQEYDRDSLDGLGLPMVATVHYGRDYDNAFWNGTQMVFGDGDGVLFNRFTIAVDVIGHELTHGVTQYESGLVYLGQPGALNEHLSDVFGSLVKQYPNETADQADWLIGAGLLAESVNGKALRSMKEPGTAYDDPVLGKDPQPAHMSDYVRGPQDNFGVHTNSGIPNHAFYLAATKIGGFAWEKAGLVWYEAMTSPMLRPWARFLNFADLTVSIAGDLFGSNSQEESAILEAWSEVGIEV